MSDTYDVGEVGGDDQPLGIAYRLYYDVSHGPMSVMNLCACGRWFQATRRRSNNTRGLMHHFKAHQRRCTAARKAKRVWKTPQFL